MRSTPSLKLGLAGLVLVGSAISAGGVAFADYGPQAGEAELQTWGASHGVSLLW